MPTTPDDAKQNAPYLDPYRRAVETHGPSFESTLWASREKQIERFAVIADMTDLTDRIILDAGAGIADLAAWLHTNQIDYRRYIGIEGVHAMAETAEKRTIPHTEFHTLDFAADPDAFTRFTPDVIIFSGSLNTFQPAHAIEVLERAWNAAKEALVFNFLSARNHAKNPIDPAPAVRWDPLIPLDWALNKTPNVRFRQDYFNGHDATITMERPRA